MKTKHFSMKSVISMLLAVIIVAGTLPVSVFAAQSNMYVDPADNWLKTNKNSYLDYYVVPNYTGNELLPRTVSLFWTGFDNKGNQVKVNLSNSGRATYNGLVGSVTLDNNSENAIINYADGTATGKYN